jgi:hypothetical protein
MAPIACPRQAQRRVRGLLGPWRAFSGSIHKRCRHGSPNHWPKSSTPSIVPRCRHSRPSVSSRPSLQIRFRPLRLPGRPDALVSATELQRSKAGKDFDLLTPGVARHTANKETPKGPLVPLHIRRSTHPVLFPQPPGSSFRQAQTLTRLEKSQSLSRAHSR